MRECETRTLYTDEYSIVYQGLSELFGEKRPEPKNMALSLQFTEVGEKYRSGSKESVLLVGHAVNGWSEGESEFKGKSYCEYVKDRIEYRTSDAYREEFLTWMDEADGKSGRRPRSMPFWQTARQIVSKLTGIASTSTCDSEWRKYIAWSNFYKVSFTECGNPSVRLCSAQKAACIEILRCEIKRLKPAYILFEPLKQNDWMAEIKNTFNPQISGYTSKYVRECGIISNSRYVISSRPDDRRTHFYETSEKEKGFILDIVDTFQGLVP